MLTRSRNQSCLMRTTLALVFFACFCSRALSDEGVLVSSHFDCSAFTNPDSCEIIDQLSPLLAFDPHERDSDALMLLPRFSFALGDIKATRRFWDELVAIHHDPYFNTDAVLEQATDPINADPVLAMSGGWPETTISEETPLWLQLALARSLEKSGFVDVANETFARAATLESETPLTKNGHGLRLIYAYWVASGFKKEAISSLESLSSLDKAWGTIGILEGLAMRGDADAVRSKSELLPDSLSIFSTMALAEAYRRSGENELAQTLLQQAHETVPDLSSGLLSVGAAQRLAAGFALLGNFDVPASLLGEFATEGWRREFDWLRIAPILACHDLHKALTSIERQDGVEFSTRRLYVADMIVAATSSGQVLDAINFVESTLSDESIRQEDRQTWRWAVLIGLMQDYSAPATDIPCASQIALRVW